MFGVQFSGHAIEIGKNSTERVAAVLIGMDSAVAIAVLVFAVFGGCLWYLH
jgi:hypothetical protein